MFKYGINNLYDCVGYSKDREGYLPAKKVGGYFMLDGERIPIINYPVKVDGLRRYFVLSTFLGYIPTDRINSFKDLFVFDNYLNEEIEWITPYYEETTNNKDEVKRLSKILGKHWKNN